MGGARREAAPAEVWAHGGRHTGDSMKTGLEVWGKGWEWCRGKVARAVPRGLLPCAAQSKAVAEGAEVRGPGGQARPAAWPGISNPQREVEVVCRLSAPMGQSGRCATEVGLCC